MDFPYQYLTDSSQLQQAINAIWDTRIIGVDTETTALHPKDGKLLTIQVATPNVTYVCNATKFDLTPLYLNLLDYDGIVILQNGKFDLQFLYDQFGYWWQGKFYDPYIAHRLKNTGIAVTFEDKFVGLDRLSLGYLGHKLNKEIRNSFQFSTGELTDDQVLYAAEDAAILFPLYEAMRDKVLDRQPAIILDLEFGVLPVTAMIEYYGIGVNAESWEQIADEKAEQRTEQEAIAKEIFSQYIDWDINLNSWQQLKKAFNECIGFDLKDTQTKTFQKHRHKMPELFDALIKYRELQTAVSRYGHNWLEHVDKNGNVHASFNQLGTDTGRYSCSDPALQTIPIRRDNRYREAFIARPGYNLITADYSQIEYRIAGEFSGEQSIIDEYLKSEPDFHQLTANKTATVLGKEVDRFTGKTMNFELIYGAGPGKLVEQLGCDMGTAKQLHSAFWNGYDRLHRYMYRTGYGGITQGYSETKMGRRRYFQIAQDTQGWKIEKMQREAGNHPIQGSVADILKLATLLMFSKLVDRGSRLVHQVHDELIVEAPEDRAQEVAGIVKTDMVKAGQTVLEIVPVEVELHIGNTWSK